VALILGSASLFIALLALWLVGEATHRKNNHNDAFVKAHVRGINANIDKLTVSLMESKNTIDRLSMRVELLESEIKARKSARADSMETLAGLEKSVHARNEGQPGSPGRHSTVQDKRGAA